jgi:hypothetical protein
MHTGGNALRHADQHNIILDLRDYVHKMRRRDLEEFEMFEKRDEDDEDLDQISWNRLLELHGTYVPAARQGRV